MSDRLGDIERAPIEAWARSLILEFAVRWDGDRIVESVADHVIAEWMRDYPPPTKGLTQALEDVRRILDRDDDHVDGYLDAIERVVDGALGPHPERSES